MKQKNFRLLVLLTIVVFFTSSCIIVINGKSVAGSGNIITEEREVAEFNKVHLKGSGNVVLTQGEQQSLQIKTDDNIMQLVETNVSGKKLTISHGKHHLRPTTFEVFIIVENLEGVSIAGSGDVLGKSRFVADTFYSTISGSGDIDLEVEAGSLKSTISGSGSINLSGKAGDYSASISGSGKINAFDLDAKDVSVAISGSGDCRVNASETLTATISGSGDVFYKGRPQINTRISGSGSLKSQD